jgi:basic membrane protein A
MLRSHRVRVRQLSIVLVIAGALATVLAFSGGASARKAARQFTVAWLWYGPKNDGGYNQSQWDPAQKLIAKIPGVKQIDADNVPYAVQGSQITERLIANGANMVIDTVGLGDLFTNVCKKYPKVACVGNTGLGGFAKTPKDELPNVFKFHPNYWTMEYLAGMAAGMMTKTNKVGFIAAYQIPDLYTASSAFALGCQAVNKKCTVPTIFTNDYFNPPKAVQAAETLINAGADIIHGWQDDPGYCQVAERRHVRAIGVWRDYRNQCPNAFITASMWTAGSIYLREVKALVAGKWKGQRQELQPIKGPAAGTALARWGKNVPQRVKTRVGRTLKAMQAGMNPFKGPIYDNKGKLRVPAGKTWDVKHFTYAPVSYLVRGITTAG